MDALILADTVIPARKPTKRVAGEPHVRRIPCTGGGDLAVEVGGKGPAVVLIHGWALDRRLWAHQLVDFRRRFTTITYDRRGCGQSGAMANLRLELEDLDRILDELKVPEASLVGMSQGGRIALRYAITRRARVNGLVLQGAPLDNSEPPAGDVWALPVARYARLLGQGAKQTLLQELGSHPLMTAGLEFAPVQAEIAAMLNDYRGEDLAEGQPSAALAQPLLAAHLAEVATHTLVLTGSKDSLWLRRAGDFTARNIRAARRRVIRDGGHFVNMTHPADYNACVIDFLLGVAQTWRS